MIKKIFFGFKKNFVFFSPFLFALYSVLFLYSKNEPEYRPHVIITPIILSLILTAIVFFAFKFIFKNAAKAVVAASLLTFISLSYGRFLEAENDLSIHIGSITATSYPIIFAITAVLFVLLILILLKTSKNLLVLNKTLIIIASILIIFPFFGIVSYETKSGRIFKPEPKQTKASLKIEPKPFSGKRPDIYYIILDRYDGQKALSEQLNFDNSKFLNFLRSKGFYVPKNSTTNYPKTFLSFAASLNMEYPDYLTKQTNGGASSDESLVTPLIQNNKVIEYLKDRGYKYIQVGSWWQPTTTNPNADISFYPPKKGYLYADEFTTGFLNTTIAAPFFQWIFHDPIDVSTDPQNNLHRQAGLYQLKTFQKIPEIEGPKFIFAHILLPHDPFVFDENCKPVSEATTNAKSHQENYISQLECTNTKTEEMINNILSKNKTKPIIILQADEGTFPINSPLPPKQSWGTATDTALKEKFPILNAYYFPDKSTDTLYDTITPVNSFRVLFNTYFGENLPLLFDKNFVFQDEENYYKFIDVTERIK